MIAILYVLVPVKNSLESYSHWLTMSSLKIPGRWFRYRGWVLKSFKPLLIRSIKQTMVAKVIYNSEPKIVSRLNIFPETASLPGLSGQDWQMVSHCSGLSRLHCTVGFTVQ